MVDSQFDKGKDPAVAACPVCKKEFHESSLVAALRDPKPQGTCERCGAWLAIVVGYSEELQWFLIGFGNVVLPVDGRGPSPNS